MLQYSSLVKRTTHNAQRIIIFSLLSLIFILPLQGAGGPKRIDAHPINVAFILSQQTDPAKMASILDYYGYQPSSESTLKTASANTERSSDTASADTSYSTYRHPTNGSTIRYTFQAGEGTPYVEVKCKHSAKEEAEKLTGLQFKKKGSAYERQTSPLKTEDSRLSTPFRGTGGSTVCTHSPGGFLLFHLTKAPQPPKGGN